MHLTLHWWQKPFDPRKIEEDFEDEDYKTSSKSWNDRIRKSKDTGEKIVKRGK